MGADMPLEMALGRELRKRMNEAHEQARLAGVVFLPVGSADGISVGDVVSIGGARSRYKVKRIDPQLSDLLDPVSPLIYLASLRGLDGPFKGMLRRIRTTSLRRV